MTSSREKLGLLLGGIGMLGFSGTLPATKLAVADIDPWFLTASRAAMAGTLALVLLVALRRPLPPRGAWRTFLVASICVAIVYPALVAIAMLSAPVAHGGVILGVMPLATALGAALLVGERPSPGFWLAAAIGGALVVAFVLLHGDDANLAVGDIFLAAAIVTGALGYTLSARLSLTMPGWEVISWSLVITLPVSIPAFFLLMPSNPAAIGARAWAGYAYCVFISQYLAFFAWNAGLAIGGIARVSQVQLLQTFVIVAAAALINREAVDAATIAFAVAVVAAVVIAQRMRVARRAPPT
ncbi:MAG: DMT family transporter [Proteobacteria bacterium]|nr:DMT family transporter [Pseudomonadota bacterium]